MSETTLIYHNAAEGWALLGDDAGALHLLDLTPAQLAGLSLGREAVIVEGDNALPATRQADGLVYPGTYLRPYLARRVGLRIAFDELTRTWYRSRKVSTEERAPYAV
jgi:hypothetical protein